MTPGSIFSVVNSVALLTWLALIARPRHPRVLQWASQIVPFVFAMIYSVIVVMRISRVDGNFNSLTGVATFFQDPWILLAGWVHYLAFDLFVGGWIATRAAELRMSHLLLVPVLLLTFMLGPIGLLSFAILKPREALS